MGQLQDCRDSAAYFRGLAEKATTERERVALLEVATSWDRAAEEIERKDQAA
jgi:hypothetical protein